MTGFVVLIVLAAAYIFYPERQQDITQLSLLAKNYNVKILRDTFGVPHIFGTRMPMRRMDWRMPTAKMTSSRFNKS